MTKNYEMRKESNKRYLEKLDEMKIRIPKGRKSTIEALAAERGESVNGLVNRLLRTEAGLSEQEWKDTIKEQE